MVKKGEKQSEETKRKISESLKGHSVSDISKSKMRFKLRRGYQSGRIKVWNKGLTKETDERIKEISENMTGIPSGHKPWNKGLTKFDDNRLMSVSKKNSENQRGKEATEIQLKTLEKGYGWGKGLTKETNESIARRSKKLSKILKGRKNPEHSEKLKKFYKENPEKHPNYIVAQRGNVTYIEKLFGEYLEELGIKAKYNYHVGRYWIDWAIINYKIGFECDGEQWHQDKEKDIKRDKKISEYGWNIFRFTGKQIINEPNKCMARIEEVMNNGRCLFNES